MQSDLVRPGPVAEEDILYLVPGEPPRQRAPATHRAPEESLSQREAGGAIIDILPALKDGEDVKVCRHAWIYGHFKGLRKVMSETTGFVGMSASVRKGLIHTFTLSPARLAAAALMCPKKDIRPYLFGVLVEVDASGARLVGTDGKKLLAVFDAQGACPSAPPEGLRLWVSDTHVKQLCAAKPRDAERIEVRVDLEAGAVLMTRDNVLLDSQESLENGRIYPNWRNIVPQQVSRESALFDAGLLGQFEKVPPALGLKNSDSAPRLHLTSSPP